MRRESGEIPPAVENYIGILKKQRIIIVQRIEELFKMVFKPEERKNVHHIHEKISMLNVEDQMHPIGGTKIKNELQSYDLL